MELQIRRDSWTREETMKVRQKTVQSEDFIPRSPAEICKSRMHGKAGIYYLEKLL